MGCTDLESEEALPASEASDAHNDTTALSFKEVTAEAGLGAFQHETGAFGEKWMPETMGAGGGFLDYDGDGHLDILLVGGSTWPGHRDRTTTPALWLYRNNGDGTFSLQTEKAGLGDVSAYGFGVTAADYDNDGDQDVFFTTLGQDRLFRNDEGVFTEVSGEAGVEGPATWSTCSLFFDADRDGFLDLYVCGYVEWSPEKDVTCLIGGDKAYCPPEDYEGLPGRYYHNNGDGTFSEQTDAAGFLPFGGKTLGIVETDLDDKNGPDLILANDSERNLLYKNNGDGTFSEIGISSGIAYDTNGKPRGGMGIDIGDVDGDGQPTLFVANFSEQMIGVYRQITPRAFIDRAAVSKIGHPSLLTLTFGLFLFDVDLDRDLDLFAANGHVQAAIDNIRDGITYQQPPQLYLNQGKGTFKEVGQQVGGVFTEPMVGRGAAYGDVDEDGDLDVLVTENGGPAHLWRNDLKSGHFLRVDLRGQQSNRDGLGARVVAVVEGERLERRVRTGSSYLSPSEKTVTFGLGEATRIDSLRVHWPSEQVDRVENLKADQELLIGEGAGVLKRTPVRKQGKLASQIERVDR